MDQGQGGGFGFTRKGPPHFIGQPIRVLGMDAYSSIGLLPVFLHPFSLVSWFIAISIFTAIVIANHFRLPSYQLFRYVRARLGRRYLVPVPEQLDPAKRSARRWPF